MVWLSDTWPGTLDASGRQHFRRAIGGSHGRTRQRTSTAPWIASRHPGMEAVVSYEQMASSPGPSALFVPLLCPL
jgi:hypothetical protein